MCESGTIAFFAHGTHVRMRHLCVDVRYGAMVPKCMCATSKNSESVQNPRAEKGRRCFPASQMDGIRSVNVVTWSGKVLFRGKIQQPSEKSLTFKVLVSGVGFLDGGRVSGKK